MKYTVNYLCFFVISCFICIISSDSDSDGWRMVDRFYGFRYEVKGEQGLEIANKEEIQKFADDQGCFGWVQRNSMGYLVGEVRCVKKRGPIMQEWLESKFDEAKFRVYEDTKIRLHFSHFKILDDSRDTCFLDAPHQCPNLETFETRTTTNTASTSERSGKNEL